MNTLLDIGLSNALVALGLAAVVAVVGRFCRRPAVMHSLWLLVLLKLVTPPLWPVHLAWPVSVQHAAAIQAPPAPAQPEPALPMALREPAAVAESSLPELRRDVATTDARTAADIALGDVTENAQARSAILAPVASPAFAPSPIEVREVPWPFSWRAAVLACWLAGSAFWLGLAGLRIVRFVRLLRHATPAPPELQQLAHELARRVGLRAAPGVSLVAGALSPLLWALGGRPRLLLPAQLWCQLEGDQRETLLVHELAHLRRRDHWVRSFELLLTALYWWHPAVWWARHALREAEELCCDAWVVWALPASAKAYATALLQTVQFLSEARTRVPLAASGVGHLSGLKRRLTMIMQETRPRALSWAGRLAVLGLAALLLPLAPTWAQRSDRDRDDPKREADRDDDDTPKDAPQRREETKRERDRARVESDDAQADREARRAKAREEVERVAKELNEQRSRIEGELREARAKFEEQVRNAQRPLRELQEQMANAQRRLAELQGPNPRGRSAGYGGGYGPRPPGPNPGGGYGGQYGGYGAIGGYPSPPGAPPGAANPPLPPVPPLPPQPPGPPPHAGAMPGPHGGLMPGPHEGGGPDLERRLSDLERKLDRVLDEVSRLKEERRSDRTRGRE